MGFNTWEGGNIMAMSSITVAGITPDLSILGSYQNFIYTNNTSSLKLTNNFIPTISIPSVTNFETRNNNLSGFRWEHTTLSTDTFGTLKLQSFINASPTGSDIITFSSTGININASLNLGSSTLTGGTWNGNTITIPYGGTGLIATTPYSVICGGTTSTGALQSVASVGTSGQVLTSQGAGALPAFTNPTLSYCSVLFTSNAVTTSISANVYTKVLGTTTTATSTANFSTTTSNRITWIGTNNVNLAVRVAIDQQHSGTTIVSFTIYKNGTSIPSLIAPNRVGAGGNVVCSHNLSAIIPMVTNDYLEVWATATNNTTLTPVNMQFTVNTLSLV